MHFCIFYRHFLSAKPNPITAPRDSGHSYTVSCPNPNGSPVREERSGRSYSMNELIEIMLNLFFKPSGTGDNANFSLFPSITIDFKRPCAAEAVAYVEPGFELYTDLSTDDQHKFRSAFGDAFIKRFTIELAKFNASRR